MTFGEFFHKLRVANGKTLRQFCKDNGFDAGNISRIESGGYRAPQNKEKLREYANALQIPKGSADWIKFFDLAEADRMKGEFHELQDDEVIERLPVLFRTLDNKKMTSKKLDKIIELIKRG